MNDAKRAARLKRFEQLGVDRVTNDLIHHGGLREVGGTPEVRDLAWEWVRSKDAESAVKASVAPENGADGSLFVSQTRLNELGIVSPTGFDFQKLIQICRELNSSWSHRNYLAVSVLTRTLLDHVPPLFRYKSFAEVANNYGGGGRSFKTAMQFLESGARPTADLNLHTQIRVAETLPTAQQVDYRSQVDHLLAEIVRLIRATQ